MHVIGSSEGPICSLPGTAISDLRVEVNRLFTFRGLAVTNFQK